MKHNIPITNKTHWTLECEIYYTNGDKFEVFGYMYIKDEHENDFINKTVHRYSVDDRRLEGITLRWEGNPFNLKNAIIG